ncbi:MAG TPA: NUDIX domain-containing protein [Chthonomonadaceae bacterium]|nr:NUDIX domain-containing protein [Chthonomonadaceae bacterium]
MAEQRRGETASPVPEFGEKAAGQEYRLRPGAYAVLFDTQQRIAILRTARGGFLPGGGSEPGETPEQTLAREVQEECGFAVRILERLGEAIEYVYAAEEAAYFAKRGVFFRAALAGEEGTAREGNSALLWLMPEQAVTALAHGSQVWAVRKAVAAGEEG